MTGTEIIAEVKARGFDYVTDARILSWINTNYQRINDREAWPFLEVSTNITAGATISDLRSVLHVANNTTDEPVHPEDLRDIRDRDPDFATTSGNVESWYFNASGFATYPSSTNSLTVYYLKVPTDIAAGTSPLWPTRYHYMLVDATVAEAYKDTDEWERYNAIIPIVETGIMDMANSLLTPAYDQTSFMTITGSGDW